MGYSGKLREKETAVKLRKMGLSYREIQEKVQVSKDTLSRWCRDVVLTKNQTNRLLQLKKNGSEKGRIMGVKKNQQKRIDEINNLLKLGQEEIGRLSKRERFLIGVALYAAEGTKVDKQVTFSNSDPKLIKFMSDWFREFCPISRNKLCGRLWIHENRSEQNAKEFWSKLCQIPISQFYKSYIAENKTKSKKIRKKLHEYGVFGITFSNAKTHRRIMGWVSGITSYLVI